MKKGIGLLLVCLFTISVAVGCSVLDKINSLGDRTAAPTPIPGWEKFEGKGVEVWLPESFEGGDLENDVDVVVQNLRRLGSEYEQTAEMIEQNPDMFAIWVFDSEVGPSGALTNLNVTSEKVLSAITLDTYLDAVSGQLHSAFAIVEREIVTLSGYEAGRLVIEVSAPVLVAKELMYAIKEGGTMWVIAYTTGADEFDERLPIFEQSAETFKIQ